VVVGEWRGAWHRHLILSEPRPIYNPSSGRCKNTAGKYHTYFSSDLKKAPRRELATVGVDFFELNALRATGGP
jgi:hypothetical protein